MEKPQHTGRGMNVYLELAVRIDGKLENGWF